MSDLIDRKNAIDVLEILADKMSDEGQTVMSQAVAVLEYLQSAEPERTAKVENIEDPAGMGAYGDCSECGAEVTEQYAYCPNCGCRLEWK